MFGFGHPIDNLRAHPWQTGIATLAGMLVPGGGMAARAGFNAYNNHQFNNAFANSQQHGMQQGNLAASNAMNAPLMGDMGAYGAGTGYTGQAGLDGGAYNMGQAWSQQNPSSPTGVLDFLGAPPPGLDTSGLDHAMSNPGGGNAFGTGSAPAFNAWASPGGGSPFAMNGASDAMRAGFDVSTQGGGQKQGEDLWHHRKAKAV